ncbi:hypothetical protein GQ457_18G016430 [Hibiscus cannabinus]
MGMRMGTGIAISEPIPSITHKEIKDEIRKIKVKSSVIGAPRLQDVKQNRTTSDTMSKSKSTQSPLITKNNSAAAALSFNCAAPSLNTLQTLDISRNTGDFPSSISKLKNLTKIELFFKNFTSELPPGIADLSLSQEIDISSNQMHGTLPPSDWKSEEFGGFGAMLHLIAFSVYRNHIFEIFPANFGRFSPLDSIDISENQFSGEFPRFLCGDRKLRLLLALENNFSGEFPDSYAECNSLERLRINKNHLSGKISDGVWALPKVTMVDFGDNEFSGGISPMIAFSISLNQLVLKNNRFSSNFLSELGKLVNLEALLLNNNSFSGEFVF